MKGKYEKFTKLMELVDMYVADSELINLRSNTFVVNEM